MSLTFIILTFVISSCIALFAVLPLGVTSAVEATRDPLHSPGAPIKANIPKKLLLAFIIGGILTAIIAYLSFQPWITLR